MHGWSDKTGRKYTFTWGLGKRDVNLFQCRAGIGGTYVLVQISLCPDAIADGIFVSLYFVPILPDIPKPHGK